MPEIEVTLLSYDYVTPQNVISFRKAAAERNVALQEWAPHRISIWLAEGNAEPRYENSPRLPRVIIHRTGARLQGIIAPALKLWQNRGTIILNDFSAAVLSRDKLATALRLSEAGLSTVPSMAFFPWEETDFGCLPPGGTIIKPAHGLQGRDVSFFETRDQAEAGARKIRWGHNREILSEHSLAQPAIGRVGEDIRAYVVNGACVTLARRMASDPAEVRANLTLGAVAKSLALDHPAASLAVAATKAVGLDYAGVDLVEDASGGLHILEVDGWAGFAGLEQATGADISGRILDMALERLR
jgi:RimK family alpha-L-glutamate ligase